MRPVIAPLGSTNPTASDEPIATPSTPLRPIEMAPASAVTSPSLNTLNGTFQSFSMRKNMRCASSNFEGFFSFTARRSEAMPIFCPTRTPAVEPPIASTRGRCAAAALSPFVSCV